MGLTTILPTNRGRLTRFLLTRLPQFLSHLSLSFSALSPTTGKPMEPPVRHHCSHPCCSYSTPRKNDRDKHEQNVKHRSCTCEKRTPREGAILMMETPESMAQKITRPKKRRRRDSIETQEATPEPTLDSAKILCVLAPTRREGSFEETVNVSWLTVEPGELQLDNFDEILSCEAL